MSLQLVSIIIPTKNEEKNIEDCLISIQNQTYSQEYIEIIVVDKNSDDKTKEIAKKYTDNIFNNGDKTERSAQRNFGAQKAKGKYYLYLDADMSLNENVIQQAVEKMESNNQLVGLYIPEIVIGNSFWCRARNFERSFYNSTVIDCVRFIRTKDFLAVQGFDEALTGPEDWDIDKKIRMRGQVDIIKARIFHNESNFNLSAYIRKKSYYIKNFDNYIQKWGQDDPDIKKQFSPYYRFFGVFTENGKWKKLVFHPILTFGMYFLRFLVGITFLVNRQK